MRLQSPLRMKFERRIVHVHSRVFGRMTSAAVAGILAWIFIGLAGCGNKDAEIQTASRESGALPDASNPPMPPKAATGFTDVTLAAGLRHRTELPGKDLRTIVESVGVGAAFADLDEDGFLDLILLSGPEYPEPPGEKPGSGDVRSKRGGGVRLYRNRTDGRFEEKRGGLAAMETASGLAVAVGDMDGDGDRDVYVIDRGPNRLFRNLGNWRFEEATLESGVGDGGYGVGAAWFDMEGDGDLDLYVANYLEYECEGTPFYAPDGYPGPLAYRAQADVLYRNDGRGIFEDATEWAGLKGMRGRAMSLAAADFDEDGDIDLFVANDAMVNYLLLNDGQGRFTETGLRSGIALGESGEATSAMATDVGDVDGDGHLDLVVSDTAYGAFYRFLRPGNFVDQVMQSGLAALTGQYVSWGQALLDYDNDGDLDIWTVNGGLKHLTPWEDLLLANDGSGRFEDVSHLGGAYFGERFTGRSLVRGDYDNDGDMDVLITNLNDRCVLLRNDFPRKDWIGLDLVGSRNRDPFGTRVRLEAGGRVWTAELRCPTAYLGQSDPRLHFGLGEGVSRVDKITIQWPDGRVTEKERVETGRILRMKQGE